MGEKREEEEEEGAERNPPFPRAPLWGLEGRGKVEESGGKE